MKPRHILNKLIEWTGYEVAHRSKMPGVDWLEDVKSIIGAEPPKLIIDVGAHEGESLTLFRAKFPEAIIHSFEPEEGSFSRLKLNMATVESQRVYLHCAALGAREGEIDLFVNEKSATNSLLPLSDDVSAVVEGNVLVAKGRSRVRVRTLDGFCREQNINGIDLLKIDVQGYELEVLRGGSELIKQRKIRAIFLEVFFAPVYEGQAFFEDVYLFLKERGYRFAGLYDLSYQRNRSVRWGDALFLA